MKRAWCKANAYTLSCAVRSIHLFFSHCSVSPVTLLYLSQYLSILTLSCFHSAYLIGCDEHPALLSFFPFDHQLSLLFNSKNFSSVMNVIPVQRPNIAQRNLLCRMAGQSPLSLSCNSPFWVRPAPIKHWEKNCRLTTPGIVISCRCNHINQSLLLLYMLEPMVCMGRVEDVIHLGYRSLNIIMQMYWVSIIGLYGHSIKVWTVLKFTDKH